MVSYRFGELVLDADAFVLRRSGVTLSMQPKALEVLRYLIEHRGRLVGKSELLEQLWRHENVNEAVVSWSVSHIRRALGQRRADKCPIETVHRRGYRFTAEVSHLGAPESSPAMPESSAPTFVGRERAMSELLRCMDEAADGRGTLCLITGEAGIGKTRCAEELAKGASAKGMRTLTGRCPPTPGTPPLWPIDAALGQLNDELAERARSRIKNLREQAESQTGQPGDAAGFRLVEEVARVLRELAAARPTLLVIDDVHWADASTLRLLGFIAPELAELPMCVVVTLRDSEREPLGQQNRVLLQVLRYACRVPLGSLNSEQVAELFAAVGKHRPSPELSDAVRRASGGVPLFVQEVVRSLIREHGGQALDRLRPDAVRIPALARDVLRERIHQLPDATFELLSRAAVIGDSFELPLLARLSNLEPELLLDRLAPAIADGQLESEAPHAYRFAHSLFQSVLYEDLPPGQRVLLHRKIAEVLASRSDSESRIGDIARHYYLSLAAGDYAEVVRRTIYAGNAATRVFAFDEAVLYYGWALEAQVFAGVAEPRPRAELLLSLAAAQRSAGRTGEAMESAASVIDLGRQEPMQDLIVGATRIRRPTVALALLPDDLSRSALELVLQQLPTGSDPVRISALAQLACVPPYDRDLRRSKELSTHAVALAEQQTDRELLFEALRARLFSLSGPDDVDEVLQVAELMIVLETAGPRSWQIVDARMARISAFLLAGRMAEVDAALADMQAGLRGRWGEATFYCQRMRAQRLFLNGRFDEAEQLRKGIFSDALRAGISYAEDVRVADEINLELERRGAAWVAEKRLLASSSTRASSRTRRATMAWIAAQAGHLDFVRAELATLGDPNDYPRDAGYLHTLACLAICAAALDDKPRCEQLLGLLSPYSQLNTPDAMGYYLGSVSYFTGILSLALGRTVRARTCFERALEHNRGMGFRAGVVRALLSLAALERQLGRRSAARASYQAARGEAQALGMHSAVADADSALARA